MTKRDKQEFYETFAEAFHDVVVPLLENMATKEDLEAFATKEDLEAFATKEDLKAFATKDDLKAFATKDDLKAFATKDDLKREVGFIRSDINDLRAEISTHPTRKEFNDLERKVIRLHA